MSRLLWLPDVLSDAFRGQRGFQVDVVAAWKTRAARTTAFEPVGVMNHHTGRGSYGALLNYMSVGSSIAPLSQIATSRPHYIKGILTVRITIMASGRANHAGRGYLSWTGTNGGNYRLIGIENQNDGSQSWPSQQLEATRITTAALLKQLQADVNRMTEHKIYAKGRKVDRHSVAFAQEKVFVKRILEQGKTMETLLTRIDNSTTVYQICGSILVPLTSAKQAEAIAKIAKWPGTWQDHVGNLSSREIDLAGFTIGLKASGMSKSAADDRYVRKGTTIKLS